MPVICPKRGLLVNRHLGKQESSQFMPLSSFPLDGASGVQLPIPRGEHQHVADPKGGCRLQEVNGGLFVCWQETYQQNKRCDDCSRDGSNQNHSADRCYPVSPSGMRNRDERGEHGKHSNQQPVWSKAQYFRQREMKSYNGAHRKNAGPTRLDISRSIRHEFDDTAAPAVSAKHHHCSIAREQCLHLAAYLI